MFNRKQMITGVLVAATASLAWAEKPAEDQLIATVNGVKITSKDMNSYVRTQPASSRPRSPKSAVAEVINRELLKQEAIKQKLDKSDDFKISMEAQRTSILVNSLLSQQVEKVDLSDKALQKEYDKQLSETDLTEYKARHILLKEESTAKDVIGELKKGGDFEKLAKEKSTGPSGAKGGDLGWFQAATMVPEFGTALKDMKKGKFSETPVKTQFGWHIILLEDKRAIEAPDFEKSKERLKQIIAQKAVQDYITAIAEKAKIEINGVEQK